MQTFLKNCTICDGSGNNLYTSGILIEDAYIKAITDEIPVNFTGQVIDCEHQLVTPGFIDCHSHNDWHAVAKDRDLFFKTFIAQGITTFVTGNCGFSAAGHDPETPFLSKIGGGLFSLDEATRQTPTFKQWFDAIDEGSIANIACLAGHGTARICVNGKKNTPLTPDQEEKMLGLLEKALQEGASGISLGLMYEPGLYAPTEELIKVARLCVKYNRILTVHPRAESAISLSYKQLNRSHLILAMEELDKIVRATGVRFQLSHLIFVGRRTWKDVDEALRILEKLKSDGYDVGFDMYPLDYGASIITVVLPDWYQALLPDKRKKPLVQFKLAIMVYATIQLLGFNFSDITIAYGGEDQKDIIGKTIAQIARERNTNQLRTYLDICEKSDFKAAVLMGSYQNNEIVSRLMQHNQSLYMTDAWVERYGKQNGGIYGAFTKFLENAIAMGYPIETAISKMTGKSASRFGLKNRGLIKEGYYADLNVINLKTLRNRIEECLPPEGMTHLFMNGKPVLINGQLMDPFPQWGMSIRNDGVK